MEVLLNSLPQDINANDLVSTTAFRIKIYLTLIYFSWEVLRRVAYMVQDIRHVTSSSEVEKVWSKSSQKLLL